MDVNYLKQEKVTFAHKQVVNIYTEILWPFTVGQDFTLGNSLFGAFKVAKNANPDEYKYSGYGTGFDASGSFLLSAVSSLVI